MKKSKNSCYFLLVYILFFSYAVGTSVLGTFMTRFLKDFDLNVAAGGIFSVLYYTGCLGGVVLSVFVLKYFRNRTWICLTYGIFAIMTIMIGFTDHLFVFLLLQLLTGISTKFLDLTINTEVSLHHEENKGFYINLLHGIFGAGSFAAPILAAKLLGIIPRWQMIYCYIGIVCFALFLIFLIKGKKNGEINEVNAQNQMDFTILKNSRMLCLLLVLFFYCGHQCGINTWVPLYLQYKYDAATMVASMGSSLFWICLVISRLYCAKLTMRIPEKKILVTGLGVATVFSFAGAALPYLSIAMLGYAAAGLFAGATIPLVLTIGYKECPEAQATVSVFGFVCISAGQVLFPWLMGVICGNLGLTQGMISNVLCLCGAVVFSIIFLKLRD